jgi:hypothetical protein
MLPGTEVAKMTAIRRSAAAPPSRKIQKAAVGCGRLIMARCGRIVCGGDL